MILFEFLMKKDRPDFNIVDSDGWSPMSRAIDFGNVEILKLLLYKSKDVDLNKPSCSGYTPLTFSIIEECQVGICELLINSGASTNQEDDKGWTFHLAIVKKHMTIVKFLKENGTNLVIRTVNFKDNAEELAIKRNNLKILKQLVYPEELKD